MGEADGAACLLVCTLMDTNPRIAALTEILAQNPSDVFARYSLAMEHANSGDAARALSAFDALLADNPGYVPAYQMAGQLLMRTGDTDRAREYLTRGLAAAEKSGNQHAAGEISGMLDEIGGS
jgi:predicted Zn-dependent protease